MIEREELERRIAEQRAELLRFVERRAGGALIRRESPEDLAQDVLARALRSAGSFEWRDEASFRAWLFEVARNHLEDRRAHWSALKRAGAQALRLGGDEELRVGLDELAASVTGPSTFAARREQVGIAAKALALLLPRDRELIEGLVEGLTASQHAERLGTSTALVESARKRALERLRKTFRLVLGQRG
jgi:RNA polymerase sigma factor (sigma-70 family)